MTPNKYPDCEPVWEAGVLTVNWCCTSEVRTIWLHLCGLDRSFESRTELRALPVIALPVVHCGGRVLGGLLLLTLPLQQKMGPQGLVSGLLES